MSVDQDFIASLNPLKAIQERPSSDALLELKMLVELAGGSDEGLVALLGQDNSGVYITNLLKNELKFVGMALKLLHTNTRVRETLGGATYENLAKLTSILKRRSDRAFVDRFLNDTVFTADDFKKSFTPSTSVGVWSGVADRLNVPTWPDSLFKKKKSS